VKRRLSSTAVTLGVGIATALTLAGCPKSEEEPTHSAVCVDEATQLRVDDDRCDDDDHHGHVWFYYPLHTSAPPVGSTVSGTAGSFTKPAGSYTTVPAKGGFGTHAGTGS
jgi:hypothetical protein